MPGSLRRVLISSDLSPSQLEAAVAKALREGFDSRGLTVTHNGTSTSTAPGGVPDIDLENPDIQSVAEVTKLRWVAQSNAEATSVTAHLESWAGANPGKLAFGLFVSPATAERT